MYIYRVLNDCDIALQPKENGIFNKRIIEDKSRVSYETQLASNNEIQPSEELFKYLLPTYANVNQFNISRDAKVIQTVVDKELDMLKNIINGNIDGYTKEEIKDLEAYLNRIFKEANESITKKSTDWISFTTSLKKILKYYLHQTRSHQVAVVESNIDGIVDNNLIGLNLGNIEDIKDYISQCDHLNLESIKLPKKDGEVLYYNYVPKEKIKAILSQFEIDLLFNNLVDQTTLIEFMKPVSVALKNQLRREISKLDNPELLELFDDVYVKNKALSNLVAKYDKNEIELVALKKQILSLISNVNLEFVRSPRKMLVLPEDYK